MYKITEAVQDFLFHCKYEKNLASKTTKAYETDLFQLVSFFKRRKFSLEMQSVSKSYIKEYLQEISVLKAKSIKRKIATIRAMFNFLEFEDRIIVSPLRKMRINIKQDRSLPQVLSLKEVEGILQFAYRAKGSASKRSLRRKGLIREIAVLELLFATGARVSEIANLKTNQIDLNSGKIVLRGKGAKERMIQICERQVIQVLKEYHCAFASSIRHSEYFFINRLGRKLSDQSIRTIVKNAARNSGLERRITPHAFRHSFGTLLLENDVDIKYIQQLLGHSSIMTTQIYTHVSFEKQRQILTNKHPRKQLAISL